MLSCNSYAIMRLVLPTALIVTDRRPASPRLAAGTPLPALLLHELLEVLKPGKRALFGTGLMGA